MRNINSFISLVDVSIKLRDQVLLEDVNWEISSDQQWAVLGANGSGKSSLMKALAGSLPIVKGRIIYHFAPQASVHEHVAYVTFESQRNMLGGEAFYQERWNVGVNEDTLSVSEFLSVRRVKSNNPFNTVESQQTENFEASKQQVIGQLELDKLLERQVVELSNGERRKVAIAQALLKKPRLLILDNPFTGLDERFRTKLAKNLDSLMQGNMRVMIVGTSRDEIPSRITHVLLVKDKHVTPLARRPARRTREIQLGKSSNLPKSASAFESATRGKPLVRMKNVSVSYNGTPVLRDVNWVVCENEKWALLGPNGAGKTTLLSLILADNPQAYANDITLFGKRRGSGESIWEIKQNIGWVSPELQLYYPPSATCLDVVCSGWFDSVGLYRESSLRQRAIALSWLQQFGLGERAEIAFARLSEGEQRLVLLARALVKNPSLFVLDEPCQGLDAANRDRVLQAINSVNHGASMIYVTHRADELPQGITHVLQLNEGQIVGDTHGED